MNWLERSQFGSDEILKVLPHRSPFLFVDKIIEVKTAGKVFVGIKDPELSQARNGSYARGVKELTPDEPVFKGHFPGNPLFPGVLTIEAMAQTAVFATVPFLAALNNGELPALNVAFGSIDDVRFRKPLRPGDVMNIKSTITNVRGSIWSFEAEVEVGTKRAAEAKFLAYLGSAAI